MTPLMLERMWPIGVALFATALFGIITHKCEFVALQTRTIPAATMTFGIVVAGFVAAQRNMLLTMTGSRVLRFVLKTNYYKHIINYLMDCIWAGLLVVLISLAGFLLKEGSPLWPVWTSALGGSVVLVVGLVCRNELLITLVVREFLKDQKKKHERTTD